MTKNTSSTENKEVIVTNANDVILISSQDASSTDEIENVDHNLETEDKKEDEAKEHLVNKTKEKGEFVIILVNVIKNNHQF